jgi:hypothetical protein
VGIVEIWPISWLIEARATVPGREAGIGFDDATRLHRTVRIATPIV